MKKYHTIELQQGTPEWLEFRRTHIGATDAAVILKKNPWKKPLQLYREKIGFDGGTVETAAMQTGRELEETARLIINKLTGHQIKPMVVQSQEKSFAIASLDGIDEENKYLCEIKCGKKAFERADKGEIPPYYICQIQHQLYVTGYEMAFYWAFDPQNMQKYIIKPVKRDEKFIREMIQEEEKFWQSVQALTPPNENITKRTDEEWLSVEKEYFTVCKQLKVLSEAKQELSKRMELLSEGKNSRGICTKLTHYTRKGAVQYGEIPELKSLNLDAFRKPDTSHCKITLLENGSEDNIDGIF